MSKGYLDNKIYPGKLPMTERPIKTEFTPSVSPSDSWDDPVASRGEFVRLLIRIMGENIKPDKHNFPRIAGVVLGIGHTLRMAIDVPVAVFGYFRHLPEDPPRSSTID